MSGGNPAEQKRSRNITCCGKLRGGFRHGVCGGSANHGGSESTSKVAAADTVAANASSCPFSIFPSTFQEIMTGSYGLNPVLAGRESFIVCLKSYHNVTWRPYVFW
eukprot:755126-Hanusia_phi.AAC.3